MRTGLIKLPSEFDIAEPSPPATTEEDFDPDEEECATLAHRLWRTSGVPGELSQELRTPAVSWSGSTT